MTAYAEIYAIVRQIPVGRVATYGQIAALAGRPRQARLVGYALYRVTTTMAIPWHRVINAQGEISQSPFRLGTDLLQADLLQAEGIELSPTGKISLARYQWQPPAAIASPQVTGPDADPPSG